MKFESKYYWSWFAGVLALILVFGGVFLVQPSRAVRAAEDQPQLRFLPAVSRGMYVEPTPGPGPQPTPQPGENPPPAFGRAFGIEPNYYYQLNELPNANVHFARLNGVIWSSVEPKKGDRNWSALANLEQDMVYAAQNGIDLILIVRSTPQWAQKVPGKYCGPVKQEEFAAFASFMQDLVQRYSQPPYSVKYWEMGNEPDIDPGLVANDSMFGCWGDRNDPYYGGGYYAEMLKVVTPAIKAVDPAARVLTGGVLLSCNPNIAGACDNYDASLPPRFLEGILRAGGEPYFDIFSFHSYDRYDGALGRYSMPPWRSSWDTTGPLILEKVKFIRSVLEAYGAGDKPLINTETGVMVYESTCGATCQNAKAYYVPQLYSATIASGVMSSIWYSTYANWKHTDLFTSDGEPLPAYHAYSVAWDQLSLAVYERELTEFEGVRGYVFTRLGRPLWLLWSADGGSHAIDLPAAPQSVVDVFGAAEAVQGAGLTVTIKPIYIQFP